MKTLKKLSFWSIILVLCFFGQCCKKKHTDPEEDPCIKNKIPNADFIIYPNLYGGITTYENKDWLPEWEKIDCDTLINNDIAFEAKENPEGNTKYSWELGAETITTQKFDRSQFPVNVLIPISLKVQKKSAWRDKCFPNTDIIFTKTRNLIVLDSGAFKSKVYGRFTGSFTNTPTQMKNIEISIKDIWVTGNTYRSLVLEGLGDYSFIYSSDIDITYKQIFFGFNNDSNVPVDIHERGLAKVYGANNDSILVKYNYYDKSDWQNPKLQPMRIFKGKRIR
jgi:hypothetical protein